ncbi:MAG: hypothetical protein IJ693_03415 [Bacteroidaceae bacterium]|nr:hypothetical protein [Bacteroidaceae bacterium]
MNLRRTIHLFITAPTRAIHRRGFGVQSPWAYELIRDVLFEPLPYYAYQEQHLDTPQQQQLFRIRNHFRHQPIVIIDEQAGQAAQRYEEELHTITPDTILILEHTHNENAPLWNSIVHDPRAIVTFDMGQRGMVIFDKKRIKQNYLL